MVFNVAPTVFEVAVVSGILTVKCGPALAGLTFGTLAAYSAFTFSVTQVRAVLGFGFFGGGAWGGASGGARGGVWGGDTDASVLGV